MALSTTDLGGSNSGSSLPKTIAPGNHTLKINKLELEDFRFIDGAKHLILHVETSPIDGFEGFLINKDDESQGRYAGQIGRVKASQYAFADGETKSGVKVYRDRSVMMFLQTLCKTLEINDWFISQNNLHETIEDFIDAFNKTAPYQDKYLNYCVIGKEYLNGNGYTNYDMWLPKAEKGKYAFSDVSTDKVITYDETLHLKKLEVKNVSNFGDDDEFTIPNKSSDSFSLD